MNKTLSLMINSIEPKHNKERAHTLSAGLLAMKDMFKDLPLNFDVPLDYEALYKHGYDSLKGGSLINKLDPQPSGSRGSYDVKGSDYTLCFWMYMMSRISEANPEDIQAWVRFGYKMNEYMYDVDSYMKHMISNTASLDKFPIGKLLSNFAIYNNAATAEIAVHLLKSDKLLETLVRMEDQHSLIRIVQRLNNLMEVEKTTWIETGKFFHRLYKMCKKYEVRPDYDIRQIRRALLFDSSSEETTTYIKRNLNGIIAEIQEGDEDILSGELSRGVLVDFIKQSDSSLELIFNSKFSPSSISLPLNELQMKLLLLTRESLSKSRPAYYESYSSASSIYLGRPDLDYEMTSGFRGKLVKELLPLAVAGYTATIEENGLTFSF